MDEAGRKNKLEELLARVRERGSGLHRAVGQADEIAALDARVAAAPHAPVSLGRAQIPVSRRSSSSFSLDIGSIGPGPLIEDDELEQIASRRSLDRYVESTLGDDEPSVPFTEEGEGWEPDALELERGEEATSGEGRSAGSAASASSELETVADGVGPDAEPVSRPDAAPKLRRRESFSELPPMPLSPFPSDPPPRWVEPAPTAAPTLDGFGDLESNGPQALPLDVPWETLAKQLRGRRRSGEFRIDEAAAPATATAEAQTSGGRVESADALEAPAEAQSHGAASTEPEPAEQAVVVKTPSAGRSVTSEPPAPQSAASEPPASQSAASRSAASEPPASEPPASERHTARPITSEPPDAIAGEPSFLRSARRSRRARKARSSTWLPIVGVALLGLLALWWNRSDDARRTSTRATSSVATAASPVPPALGEPSEPRLNTTSPAGAARANATSAPLIAAATATAVVAPSTTERAASAEIADTPPKEPLGETEGWLRVRGRRFSVYLNGGLAGATGQWIRTSCGVRHLRLAHVDPPPRGRSFPWWVDDGGPVVVPCGASTTVEVDPGGRR